MKEKVFGIGLSKTGTTSLVHAFRMLGYRSIHYPKDLNVLKSKYDAAADISIAVNYKELDGKYPNAKFILTIRDVDSWLRSMESDYENRIKLKGPPSEASKRYRTQAYGTIVFEKDKVLNAFKKHNRKVRECFKGRPGKLLVMNIINGDGWDKLCPFLGKSVPEKPFPKKRPA